MRISKERLKELIKEELQNVIEADAGPGASQVARDVINAMRVGDTAEDQVLTSFVQMWGKAAAAGNVGRNTRVLKFLGLIEQALQKFLADPEGAGGAEGELKQAPEAGHEAPLPENRIPRRR